LKLDTSIQHGAILAYSLNPYIIFNHTYIRMFVFYELFLLITLLLSIKVIQDLTSGSEKYGRIYTLVALNVFFIATKELENYIFVAISLLTGSIILYSR